MYSRKLRNTKLKKGNESTSLPVIPERSKILQVFWYFISSIILISAIIFYFLFAIVRVDGHSMDPTLQSNQLLLLKKQVSPARFDIVVLTERMENNGVNKQIVKRVIGFGGERVTVLKGRLFINDVEYHEGYLKDDLTRQFRNDSFTILVPDGYLFVMGDNRDISKDSRSVGCFKVESVNGVILR